MIIPARLSGTAGTAAVHGAALWLVQLALPLSGALVGPACTCWAAEPLRRPIIAILPAGGGMEERGGQCLPGPDVERLAEPLFALFANPLVRTSSATAVAPTICARIGITGRVDSAWLVSTSGDPDLDRAAAAALHGLSFSPARGEGRPRSAWHRIVVTVGTGAQPPPGT